MTTESTEPFADTEETPSTDEQAQGSEVSGENTDASALVTALQQAEDKYIRLAAEFENFKKRTARERIDLINSANDRLLLQMLDAVDNFERALESAEKGQDHENPQKLYNSLHEGARMIHQQLIGVLKAQGVEEIETAGKQFDPALHEAVVQIETDEHPEDHISQVISKGYKRGDRILRHSKVGVAAKEKS